MLAPPATWKCSAWAGVSHDLNQYTHFTRWILPGILGEERSFLRKDFRELWRSSQSTERSCCTMKRALLLFLLVVTMLVWSGTGVLASTTTHYQNSGGMIQCDPGIPPWPPDPPQTDTIRCSCWMVG